MTSFYTSVERYGKNLLYRGYEGNRRVQRRVPFSPTLYVKDAAGTVESIFGDKLIPKNFTTMADAKAFLDSSTDFGVEVFGNENYIAQYVQEMWPDDIPFDQDLINIVYTDIEVKAKDGFPEPEQADWPVDSITLYSSKKKRFQVYALYQYDPDKTELDEYRGQIDYEWCENEIDLLSKTLTWLNDPDNAPDVLSGWHIDGFDIPYLVNRITKIMGDDKAKLLSPWGMIEAKEYFYKGLKQLTYNLKGIAQLDFLNIFKKLGYKYGPQESYRLDHIAHVVLGKKKLDHSDYDGLQDLAAKNPQKYIDYNIKDVGLIVEMEDTTKLLSLTFAMAYRAGVNFEDVLGTTRIWDTIIYRDLMRRGVVVQPNKHASAASYPGGYVKPPHVGFHNWVGSFDLNSLYPNIIVEYNMSPETIVDGVRKNIQVDSVLNLKPSQRLDSEYAVAANGVCFSKKKQGVLPRLIVDYYDERKAIQAKLKTLKIEIEKTPAGLKKETMKIEESRLYNQQMAIKILMNSLYGALGNRWFRHYDLRIAEGITLTGQLTILSAEQAVNSFMNKAFKTDKDYVIAIDTDSVYVNMSPFVEHSNPKDPVEYLSQVAEQVIEPVLDAKFEDLHYRMNSYTRRMVMGREVIAKTGVWTAKKRYALSVYDDEGVRLADPKLKIMGIQAIQSSTPMIVRQWLKEAITLILQGDRDPVIDYIVKRRAEFKTLSPEDIAAPRGVNEVDKYIEGDNVKKGTPINSRAAIVYNRAIKDAGLDRKYELIRPGDKMKFVFMRTPNPLKSNVLGFLNIYPRELKLEHYIDYETQFDKVFTSALEPIMTAIGWSMQEETSLEDFFI